jgi:uncharacterized protein
MALPFLDSNILLRHFTQDHPQHSPKATALLRQVEQGALQVRLSEIVLFETVYTLERTYKQSKAHIRQGLLALLALPSIVMPSKKRYRDMLDLYVTYNIPFADAYIAVQMRQSGSTDIYSFDRDFDKIAIVTRVEP